MNNLKWTCALATDEHWFNEEEYDTREEAIKAGREQALKANKEISKNGRAEVFGSEAEYEIPFFLVGRIIRFEPKINTVSVLEQISEEAWDFNEYVEEYLCNVRKEDQAVLDKRVNEVLKEWLKEFHYEPSFYQYDDTQEVPVEEEK